MKIKNIYIFSASDHRNMIEMPDGKLYTFLSSPYRKITEKDLTEVKTPLSPAMYIKASHAFKPTDSFIEFAAKQYGFEAAAAIYAE